MIARTLVLTAALTTAAAAQGAGQAPRFEVASIKENKSGAPEGGLRAQPGGRIEWTNTTLRGLIGTAYQRFGFDMRQTVGGPEWLDTARFDVLVQTGSGNPPVDPDGFPGQLFAMIRTLLEERFALVVHNEVREQPVYRLVTVRPGTIGPGLKRVAIGCAAAMKAMTGGERPPIREGRGPDCTFGGPPGRLQGNAVTIDMISRVLGRQVNRPVINQTGLDGSFDLDLHFSPEFAPPPPGAAPGDPPPAASDAPSIFTAVQEQLGLRLESTRGPADVLVVDKAERPTEN